jgi:hypothetical protein
MAGLACQPCLPLAGNVHAPGIHDSISMGPPHIFHSALSLVNLAEVVGCQKWWKAVAAQ